MTDSELLSELRGALAVLDDSMTCEGIGPHLTCNEANELARALILAGFDDAAGWLLDGHAWSDEEGDDESHLGRVAS